VVRSGAGAISSSRCSGQGQDGVHVKIDNLEIRKSWALGKACPWDSARVPELESELEGELELCVSR
jgi:hypothetical protein